MKSPREWLRKSAGAGADDSNSPRRIAASDRRRATARRCTPACFAVAVFAVACSRPPVAGAGQGERNGACGSLDAESCFEELPLSPPVAHGQRMLVMTRTGFGARSNQRLDGYRQFVVVELTLAARRVVLVGDCPPDAEPRLLGVTGAGAPTILCRHLISGLHVFGVSTGQSVEWRWREAPFEPSPGALKLRYVVSLADDGGSPDRLAAPSARTWSPRERRVPSLRRTRTCLGSRPGCAKTFEPWRAATELWSCTRCRTSSRDRAVSSCSVPSTAARPTLEASVCVARVAESKPAGVPRWLRTACGAPLAVEDTAR